MLTGMRLQDAQATAACRSPDITAPSRRRRRVSWRLRRPRQDGRVACFWQSCPAQLSRLAHQDRIQTLIAAGTEGKRPGPARRRYPVSVTVSRAYSLLYPSTAPARPAPADDAQPASPGKTGLADKASWSIRPVGRAVLQLTLFVEHNNIASLQLQARPPAIPTLL